MPLTKGRSKKAISSNIAELNRSKPSAKRAKAIRTLARRRGIAFDRAKQILSKAIAFAKAGRSRKKKNKKKKKK